MKLKLAVCDVEDCAEAAAYSVLILEGEFDGLDFDACSVEHLEAYLHELAKAPSEQEEK